MHLLHPIAEAVDNHAPHNRMIGVERISGAAEIGVARSVLFQNVVGVVVEAAKAERRPVVVALGGVIEDNIQDDLDSLPGGAPSPCRETR